MYLRLSACICGFLLLSQCLWLSKLQAEEPSLKIPDTLDLQTALEFALENNFPIREAAERIQQQQGLILEVKSVLLPKVELNYNYGMIDRNLLEEFGGGAFGSDQDWSVNLEVRQRIYAGRRGTLQLKSEKHLEQAAILEMRGIINEQLLLVRERFYLILLSLEKIKVQEGALQLLEQQLKDVQDRYDSGTLSKFELLRAQVALANGKPPLIQAKNDYRIALEELREVLGVASLDQEEFDKVPEFIGTLEYQAAQFDLWSALQTARGNRPDFLRLYEVEQAREYFIKRQQRDSHPTLNLVGGYQVRKSTFTNELDETIQGWTIGLEGTWNIFDGFARGGRVAQARSQLRQAKLAIARKTLEIDVEVRRAYSIWQEAQELVQASTLVVEQAEEALRLADTRFEVGSGTQLELMQTQVELTQAKTNKIEAFYNYNISSARLRKAMGIGEFAE